MPIGSARIRQEFDKRLQELGVDVFTLYVPDAWHPSLYFSQEVDPWHWYPQTIYTGMRIESLETKGLVISEPEVTIYSEAQRRHTPLHYRIDGEVLDRRTPFAEVIDRPCFWDYRSREEIQSSIRISTHEPIHGFSSKPDTVFLNSRSREILRARSDGCYLHDLLCLGRDMLECARSEFHDRRRGSPAWADEMQRELQSMDRMLRVLQRHRRPSRPDDLMHVCRELVDVLVAHVDSNNARQSTIHASLHLLRSTAEGLILETQAAKPLESKWPGNYTWKANGMTEDDLSITLVTALTGRVHALRIADHSDEPSVLLPVGVTIDEKHLPTDESLKLQPIRGSRLQRLILKHRYSPSKVHDDCADSVRINAKLARVRNWHFGDIFKQHGDVKPGGAEICVPIIVDGQSIGCINFESAIPDSLDYPLINTLTSLAAVAGSIIAEFRDEELVSVAQRTVRCIYQSPSPADEDIRYHLDDFAEKLRDQVVVDAVDIIRVTGIDSPDAGAKKRFHPNPTFVRIATTEDVGGAMPRPRGWSEFLLMRQELVGVVLAIDKCEVLNAYGLKLSKESVSIEPAGSLLNLDEHLTVVSERWTNVRLLIGLKLFSRLPPGAQSDLHGFIWFAYRFPGRAYARSAKGVEPSIFALTPVLPALWRTAGRAIPVPLAYSVEMRKRDQLMSKIQHGPGEEVRRDLAEEIRVGAPHQNLRALSECLSIHWEFLRRIEGVEHIDQLIRHAEHSPARHGKVEIQDIVDDCWRMAAARCGDRFHQTPKLAAQSGAVCTIATRDKLFLQVALFNILSNVLKYTDCSTDPPTVTLDANRDMIISDLGPFRSKVLEYRFDPKAVRMLDVIDNGTACIYFCGYVIGGGEIPTVQENDQGGTTWLLKIRN